MKLTAAILLLYAVKLYVIGEASVTDTNRYETFQLNSSLYDNKTVILRVWVPQQSGEVIVHASRILLMVDELAKHRILEVMQAHPTRHESVEWEQTLRRLKHRTDVLYLVAKGDTPVISEVDMPDHGYLKRLLPEKPGNYYHRTDYNPPNPSVARRYRESHYRIGRPNDVTRDNSDLERERRNIAPLTDLSNELNKNCVQVKNIEYFEMLIKDASGVCVPRSDLDRTERSFLGLLTAGDLVSLESGVTNLKEQSGEFMRQLTSQRRYMEEVKSAIEKFVSGKTQTISEIVQTVAWASLEIEFSSLVATAERYIRIIDEMLRAIRSNEFREGPEGPLTRYRILSAAVQDDHSIVFVEHHYEIRPYELETRKLGPNLCGAHLPDQRLLVFACTPDKFDYEINFLYPSVNFFNLSKSYEIEPKNCMSFEIANMSFDFFCASELVSYGNRRPPKNTTIYDEIFELESLKSTKVNASLKGNTDWTFSFEEPAPAQIMIASFVESPPSRTELYTAIGIASLMQPLIAILICLGFSWKRQHDERVRRKATTDLMNK